MSGGSLRQFFNIISRSIRFFISRDRKVDLDLAEKIVKSLGSEISQFLYQTHKQFIRDKKYERYDLDEADEKLLFELTYTLILLKHEDRYEINPLLEGIYK